MTLRIFLVISMMAAVAPAAVKRDEFGGSTTSEHSGSGTNANSNYQPASSGSNQGNLYYYYYPSQDKGKEHQYQASSSNQFTSAVTPGNGQSSGSEISGQHSPIGETPANGQDLSYSAQDLSYSAQSLGQGLGQNMGDYSNQGGSNYGELSNIASQLQQYGFQTGSSGSSAFNPSGSAYAASPSSYNSGGNSYNLNSDGSNPTQYSATAQGSSQMYPGSSPANGSPSFPASGDSNPYQAPGPISSFGPAANGYGAQPGPVPFGSQSGGYPYPSNNYDSYPAASNSHASYEPPSTGYRRYGIGSAILPILALAGLSLLIPTVTSLSTAATGRRRRSADTPAKESAFGAYFDRIERYYSLYKTAVEREECMNRIICEMGDAMSNVRGKSTLFNIMERFVPTWMGNKVGVLKNGALSSDYGKCKKYTCQ